MSSRQLLVACGGDFHDFRGIASELKNALEGSGFAVHLALDDLEQLAGLPGSGYDAGVRYHTRGSLTAGQESGLISYVASGRGFVGIHSAADSFRDSPVYQSMIGGYFVEHPAYRPYQISTVPGHELTADLDPEFFVEDEMYVTSYDSRAQVLATALWKGGTVPVAWCKPWGHGRVFYLALGHDARACQQPAFLTLLRRGTDWASQPGTAGQSTPAPTKQTVE
jgi:type 1 glutamine amidotransferase